MQSGAHGETIDGDQRFCQRDRTAYRGQRHRRGQVHLPGMGQNAGQCCRSIQPGSREDQMVIDSQGAEAQLSASSCVRNEVVKGEGVSSEIDERQV